MTDEDNARLEWANSLLPSKPHSAKGKPHKLVYTIIAEPKFGKTSFACSFPDSLLLAFEQGHAFIEAHKIVIDAWDYNKSAAQKPAPWVDEDELHHMSFEQAVEAITISDRFQFIVIDTADMAAKMCLDYHLKKNNLMHQGDWDFGKGHDVCLNKPFRQMMGRLITSGRGIAFITHTETSDSRFAGQIKSKKESTLPKGIAKFLIPQSDIILHGKFGPRDKETQRRTRIFYTEGSDEVLAGARGVGQQYNLPPRYIVNQQDPWNQWLEFFNDEEAAARAYSEYQSVVDSSKGQQSTDAAESTPKPETLKPVKAKAK